MVEYYDSKRKALIKITKMSKPSKNKKKMYRKNRLSQLGQIQQTMLADLVFTRGMSRKDPETAPIDQRERILAARENEKVMNANLQALTAAVQALTRERTDTTGQAEKEFISIATQSDLITVEDILMSDREKIGPQVFDNAVLSQTKKARLKLLSQDNPTFDLFVTGTSNISIAKVKKALGMNTTDINSIYDTVSSSSGREMFPILGQYKYLRQSFDAGESPTTEFSQEEIERFNDPKFIRAQAASNLRELERVKKQAADLKREQQMQEQEERRLAIEQRRLSMGFNVGKGKGKGKGRGRGRPI